MNNWLILILLTFVPGFELRASIPYGLVQGLPWLEVFLVAVVANILVGVLAWWGIELLLGFFLRFSWFARLWHRYVERMQRKAHATIEKYGPIGLTLFIGVPLPLTGAYSGAVVSHIFGIRWRHFIVPCAIGVVIAGVLVTLVMMLGLAGWDFLLKI